MTFVWETMNEHDCIRDICQSESKTQQPQQQQRKPKSQPSNQPNNLKNACDAAKTSEPANQSGGSVRKVHPTCDLHFACSLIIVLSCQGFRIFPNWAEKVLRSPKRVSGHFWKQIATRNCNSEDPLSKSRKWGLGNPGTTRRPQGKCQERPRRPRRPCWYCELALSANRCKAINHYRIRSENANSVCSTSIRTPKTL